MVKGVYSIMIRNLKFTDGFQDIHYIHAFIMDPEFGLMENIMPKRMGNLSQILKLYKGDPDTPYFRTLQGWVYAGHDPEYQVTG